MTRSGDSRAAAGQAHGGRPASAGGAVVIRVSAPPVDGKANEAGLQAHRQARWACLGRAVRIVRGETRARQASCAIDGLSRRNGPPVLLG